jgi:hypothetical protein
MGTPSDSRRCRLPLRYARLVSIGKTDLALRAGNCRDRVTARAAVLAEVSGRTFRIAAGQQNGALTPMLASAIAR